MMTYDRQWEMSMSRQSLVFYLTATHTARRWENIMHAN